MQIWKRPPGGKVKSCNLQYIDMKTVSRAIWISILAAFGTTPFSWKKQSTPELKQQSLVLFLLKLQSQSFIIATLGNSYKTHNFFSSVVPCLGSVSGRGVMCLQCTGFSLETGEGFPHLWDMGSFPSSCPLWMWEFPAGNTHFDQLVCVWSCWWGGEHFGRVLWGSCGSCKPNPTRKTPGAAGTACWPWMASPVEELSLCWPSLCSGMGWVLTRSSLMP